MCCPIASCPPLSLPPSPYFNIHPNPKSIGPASTPGAGPYGPCTAPCTTCGPCCKLQVPVPQPCCSPFQKTPEGPCPLEPPQMMVCYRRPSSTCPGKEEYQCFPCYYKLPEIGNVPGNLPQPFNPLPPCCP